MQFDTDTKGPDAEPEQQKDSLKKLREQLFYKPKNGMDRVDTDTRIDAERYCEGYKHFLDAARTEREAVAEAIARCEQEGFVPLTPDLPLTPGTKVYYAHRGKALMLAVIGKASLSEGCHITAAHVDSPRLDLKQRPLYEDNELAYFKTHYYGGIKKYQWLTIPLELHGVVACKSGACVSVCIGRDPDDPQFVITDLLPHLASEQMQKTASKFISGEGLNLLIGSEPYEGEGKDRVKLAIMSILHDRYDITEEDFLSAELEVVPGFDVRDIGLDRSMIGGYGHDDRVCAYAQLRAILDAEAPHKTAVCLLVDKEEIGSEGITGMQSAVFEDFIEQLCSREGVSLYRCLDHSLCLSADVCNAFDPNYPEVSDKRNSARLNYGVGLCKFTGVRGKAGSNDADAELIAAVRRLFDEKGVVWQMAELGKVDQGGGGTVAKYMARRNIPTLDAGVPVLSMHAPWEVVSKLDCYMTYKGMKAFYEMA